MSALAGTLAFRNGADVKAVSHEVVAQLNAGGLIAYPTETVYGLGGSISDEGVTALHRLKGRPSEKPFLLLVAGEQMIEKLDLEWNKAARALARQHWPGPLTLVLIAAKGRDILPPGLVGPGGGVAVRWTSHPELSQFLWIYGRPITSTSANIPGAAPATSAADVARHYDAALRQRELILLDGGELPPSGPSTVIDCTDGVPRMLRQGSISTAELRETIPELMGNE